MLKTTKFQHSTGDTPCYCLVLVNLFCVLPCNNMLLCHGGPGAGHAAMCSSSPSSGSINGSFIYFCRLHQSSCKICIRSSVLALKNAELHVESLCVTGHYFSKSKYHQRGGWLPHGLLGW